MKSILGACVLVLGFSTVVAAQNPTAPVTQQRGIQVQLPVLSQAVAMPDADRADATVLTVTAEGDLYVGTDPTDVAAIAGLRAPTVYVKADARVPYEQLLTLLSALRGRQVVLLTGATKMAPQAVTPPYGVSVTVGAR
jgi:biopolymer transport protein ExbD